MISKMCALQSSGIWGLFPLPLDKTIASSHWILTVKVEFDGQGHRLEARLVAKGYTQIKG